MERAEREDQFNGPTGLYVKPLYSRRDVPGPGPIEAAAIADHDPLEGIDVSKAIKEGFLRARAWMKSTPGLERDFEEYAKQHPDKPAG